MTTNHEHLREVADRATPGPYIAGWNGGLTGPTCPSMSPFCGGREWDFIPVSKGMETIALIPRQVNATKDEMEAMAKFIATFNPATVKYLLDELAALRKENEAMREALLVALPYVTDAEGFPEQFKPGVVRRHVKQVREAIGDSHE